MRGKAMQQQCIGALVQGKTQGRDQEEAPQRLVGAATVRAEAQVVVPQEGQAEGAEPARHIGHQGPQARTGHQSHDHQPVQGRGGAAHQHEADKLPGQAQRPAHAATPAPRSLCICVDDLGLHPGINAAAFALARAGRVQALSCMVGAPAWDAAARTFREELAGKGQALDMGWHLDLSEHPLTLAPQPLQQLILRSTLRRLDPQALRRELAAQLDAFCRSLGRLPDFVDGHQHVHQLPQVREALMDLLQARGARPWLRSTRRADEPLGSKAWLIQRLGQAALARQARARGLPQNEHLLGVYDFQGGEARYQSLLQGWLAVARSGDLLMTHPSAAPDPRDPIGAARRAECAVLSAPDFEALCEEQGLRLEALSLSLARAQAISDKSREGRG